MDVISEEKRRITVSCFIIIRLTGTIPPPHMNLSICCLSSLSPTLSCVNSLISHVSGAGILNSPTYHIMHDAVFSSQTFSPMSSYSQYITSGPVRL